MIERGASKHVREPVLCCRYCGKAPKLKHVHEVWGGELLVTSWYECRRWFGLALCQRAADATNVKTWADLGERRAREAWNRQQLRAA